MMLFVVSIPLMVIAVAIAVVPLVAVSRKDLRHIAGEFEEYRSRHHSAHEGRRVRTSHRPDRTARHAVPVAAPSAEHQRRHEHVPVRHDSVFPELIATLSCTGGADLTAAATRPLTGS